MAGDGAPPRCLASPRGVRAPSLCRLAGGVTEATIAIARQGPKAIAPARRGAGRRLRASRLAALVGAGVAAVAVLGIWTAARRPVVAAPTRTVAHAGLQVAATSLSAEVPAAADGVLRVDPTVPPGTEAAPAARADGAALPAASPPIPILMYHVIDVPPPGAPLPDLYVSPDLFAAQVAALAAAGYHALTLQQAYDVWQGWSPAPPRPIVFTFDDGYVSVVTHALPVLAARGWPGVLNLRVGRIGVPGGLTPDQIRDLVQHGWEVDDHTVTHPDLTTLSPGRLQEEIVGAAERIRREFGVPARFFCYPAGHYNPAVVAAVRAAGFLGATTTWPGDAYPPTQGYFTLDRIRVDRGESPARLLAVLAQYAAELPPPPPPAFPPPSPVTPSRAGAVAAAADRTPAPAVRSAAPAGGGRG